jgi:acylphosphatase
MSERRAYRISGLVQGVGFRYFARSCARSLALQGWVCNCNDGTVKVEVEGESGILQDFEERLQEGPSTGQVEKLERVSVSEGDPYQDFEIRFGI